MSYYLIQTAPRAVALALSYLAVNAVAQMPHHHAGMAMDKPATTADKPATTAVVPPSASVAPPATDPLGYQSAFSRYKSYRDEKTGVWRDANETVGGIGGWRAYAKEAQQPDVAAPAKPNPHAGHGAKP